MNPWDVILRYFPCQNPSVSRVEGSHKRRLWCFKGSGVKILGGLSFLLAGANCTKVTNSGSVQDQGCLQVVTSFRILQLQKQKNQSMTAIDKNHPVCVQTIYN